MGFLDFLSSIILIFINPYQHTIDILERRLRDRTNEDNQLHADMYGQNGNGNGASTKDDNGTPISTQISGVMTNVKYPGKNTKFVPEADKVTGLFQVQTAIEKDTTSNKNIYDTNVANYYKAQQDIFGESQTNQLQSNGTDNSLIKQITDLSGQILVANEKNKYLNMTELTGLQFSFEALKEQNNSLNNQINENKVTYSGDESKIEYQIQQNSSMKAFNSILLIIYGICLLVLASILFGINARFSLMTKIAIVVVFVLFPFCFIVIQQIIELLSGFINKNYPNSNVYFAS
jgi:hypothetical protein